MDTAILLVIFLGMGLVIFAETILLWQSSKKIRTLQNQINKRSK